MSLNLKNVEVYHLSMKKQLALLLQDGFKELFADSATPYGPHIKQVDVFRRDPIIRKPGEMSKQVPCVAINRIADGESNKLLGDYHNDGSTQTGIKGRYFTEVFEVRVWAQNPELRDDIYDDVKKIILVGKQRYLVNDVIDENGDRILPYGNGGAVIVRVLSGIDEADHNFFPGKPMFWGTLQIALVNPFLFEEDDEGKYPIFVKDDPQEGEVEFNVKEFIDGEEV
jgi:hypothetical protein